MLYINVRDLCAALDTGFDMSSGAELKIGTTNGLTFSSGTVTQSGSPTAAIKAYTLKDKEIKAADLNGFRGSFSFKAAGIDNSLFGKNVKAFDVPQITTDFATVNTNQEIPAGVYLATSWGDVKSITSYDDFSKCTFIAIDPNSISKVTRLLNTNGASVYNISFESGKADEEKGKYLSSGYTGSGSAFALLAQGMAVADLNTPQYQFVISAVDTVANEVTFTNREAGNTFTCVLDTTANAGVYNVVATTGTVKVIVPTLNASNEYVYTTCS